MSFQCLSHPDYTVWLLNSPDQLYAWCGLTHAGITAGQELKGAPSHPGPEDRTSDSGFDLSFSQSPTSLAVIASRIGLILVSLFEILTLVMSPLIL